MDYITFELSKFTRGKKKNVCTRHNRLKYLITKIQKKKTFRFRLKILIIIHTNSQLYTLNENKIQTNKQTASSYRKEKMSIYISARTQTCIIKIISISI